MPLSLIFPRNIQELCRNYREEDDNLEAKKTCSVFDFLEGECQVSWFPFRTPYDMAGSDWRTDRACCLFEKLHGDFSNYALPCHVVTP